MYEKKKPKIVHITQELAEKHFMLPGLGRKMTPNRVDYYRALFKNGGPMLNFDWSYAVIKGTGEVLRLNGQHTSGLFSNEPHLIRPDSDAVITEYSCSTMEDACAIYAVIDSRMPTRSMSDVGSAYAQNDPVLASMPICLLRTAMSGIAYGEYGERNRDISIAKKGDALSKNVPFAMLLNNLLDGPKVEVKRFMSMPVVGAMHRTFIVSPNDSERFWRETIDETGKSRECPTRVLAKFIREAVLVGGIKTPKNNGYSLYVNRTEMVAKCLHAWNAYRQNKRKFEFPKFDPHDERNADLAVL